ncbi:MAG: hypothetical protein M3424_00285 [Actinomycetota bacterium]|nr:hypothetical protein [Actinomycetota bacterium]
MNEQGRNPGRTGQGPDETLRQALHGAAEGFDYDALVSGTHRRATRIRRHRAVLTGAAAAVLVPALVGGALLGPGLLPDDPISVGPAASSQDPSTTEPTATEDAVATATDDAVATATEDAAATATEDAAATSAPDPSPPSDPPWQDEQPPSAPSPTGGEGGQVDSGNAWEIPDPRPTGVDALDDLGTPRMDISYRRLAPAMGAMVCNGPAEESGLTPVGGRNWSFDAQEPGDRRGVEITVTAWEDGAEAMQGLRADTLYCSWDDVDRPESVQAEATWPGREDDPDRFLNAPFEGNGSLSDHSVSVAAVRTGDYLVAVTVRDPEPGVAAEAAIEIADKTAENLAALDPEHGQD